MTLVILLSLETVESLQIGVVTHFQVTPLFSMKAVFLASSQSCHIDDVDTWCKRALRVHSHWTTLTLMASTHIVSPKITESKDVTTSYYDVVFGRILCQESVVSSLEHHLIA